VLNIRLITKDKAKGLKIFAELTKEDNEKVKVILDEIILGIFNKHKLTPVEALFVSIMLHNKMKESMSISIGDMDFSSKSGGN